jgi:gluconate 5-dehydrogenase
MFATSASQDAAPERSLFDLGGRVALVTGGGTHLGAAMAEALCDFGARCYLAGRRTSVVEAAAESMRSRGCDATALTLDVTDVAAVDAAVERIVDETGRLDVAVCNAGANAESSYPPDTDVGVFRRTIESHVVGTVNTATAAARRMRAAGSGSIITISSVHGSLAADPRLYEGLTAMPIRSSLAYQTAKAGIIGATRNLAAELGRAGVRVNCISPGHIPKDEADPEFVRRVVDGNALGIKGRPEDLRGAVVLLASDAGRFITGHNLVVDGGWSVW